MRFGAHQAQALARSRRLTIAFAAALAAVVIGVNVVGVLVVMVFSTSARWADSWQALADALPPYFLLTNSLVTALLVLGGAWLERSRLQAGGTAVALGLGARPLDPCPTDPAQRRLRQIADEMAIAACRPVPQLFVLERSTTINACAAGHDPRDAAIVVTRGALDQLTRDELQGVYAHEFAHVLNGDIALNMRLAACARGVLVIHEFGCWLFGLDAPRDGDPRERFVALHPVRWLIGGALMTVGSVGWLAARLLQAGVGREREHLADASAVRLTRLPAGLGGALRKLRWQDRHERKAAAPRIGPDQWAHLWISSPGTWQSLLATHPPLDERIRRVLGRDPGLRPDTGGAEVEAAPAPAREPVGEPTPGVAMIIPWSVAGMARPDVPDAPDPPSLPVVPPDLDLPAARDRDRAGPLILELLRDRVRDETSRLTLFDMAADTLRRAEPEDRERWIVSARQALGADAQAGVFEFGLYLILVDRLSIRPAGRATFGRQAKTRRADATVALAILLQAHPAGALQAAGSIWGQPIMARSGAVRSSDILAAIRTIGQLKPLEQAVAVKALAAATPLPGDPAAPAAPAASASPAAPAAPGAYPAWLRLLCMVWGVPLPV